MKLRQLFDELSSLGIRISADNGNLKIIDPRNKLTNDLLLKLKRKKKDILDCLASAQVLSPENTPFATLNERELAIVYKRYPQIENVYIATPMQQGMLYHEKLENKSQSFLNQKYGNINGIKKIEAFKAAWKSIIDRHDVFRTCFDVTLGEQAHQLVMRKAELPIYEENWSGLSEEEQNRSLLKYYQEDLKKGFDLASVPLMRLSLIQLSEYSFHFIWTYHHLLTDGWCLPIILKELVHYYQVYGSQAEVPLPEPIPYEKYISWLYKQDKSKARDYWEENLRNVKAPTPLIVDRLPIMNSERGCGNVTLKLSETISRNLINLAKSCNATVNVIVQAAWSYLLKCYCGDSEVVFGATVSGRPAEVEGIEQMVGLFIASLPVRVFFEKGMTLGELFFQLQAGNLDREEYSYLGLPEIQALSQIPQGVSLFDSLLVFENYPVDDAVEVLNSNFGSSMFLGDISSNHLVNYSITITAQIRHSLRFDFSFRKENISKSAIDCLTQSFNEILLKISKSDPHRQLNSIDLVSESERRKLLIDWNRTDADYSKSDYFHEIFEQQVKLTPDAIAIVCGNKSLSYSELNQQANQLSAYLLSKSIKPDELVGICLKRSIDMVVAMLGVLKSGGAYLPLDPDYPMSRLSFMIADSNMTIVLTQEYLRDHLSSLNTPILCLDQPEILNQLKRNSHDNVSLEFQDLKPSNLAYVIYTSGSTGKPKGVMVEHKSLVNYLLFSKIKFMDESVKGSVVNTSFSFDATICSLHLPLISGKCVFLIEEDSTIFEDVADTMKSSSNLYKLTPSHLSALKHYFDEPLSEKLKHVFVIGGEPFPMSEQLNWQRLFPSAKFVNEYGPTEATVGCSTYIFNTKQKISSKQSMVPIGKPSSNIKFYVLNDQKKPCALGTVGELFIGGASLARGYLNRPILTDEKFIYHNVVDGMPERLYRTGDLVRWLHDGNLEFVGRVDDQVKLQGFRIELTEIEAVLSEIDGIEQSVVVVHEDKDRNKHLVTYVVLENPIVGDEQVVGDEQAILNRQHELSSQYRNILKVHLPEYMIPTVCIFLDCFPLTENGKLDRRGLPEPIVNNTAKTQYVDPRNSIEDKLCCMWQKILKVNRVGIDDDVFQLGGHSLALLRMIEQIRAEFSIRVTLKEIYDRETVRKLGLLIESEIERSMLSTEMALKNKEEIEEVEF
ncbi:amino acid adenylation domain-containing protein [Microbulbifer epialgicus]|uniref:Amino acid adenylation domain-containing protein n=1 Tax=Microbulbifer epialgicus TaxID=393907 RepID=A0ABV4P668_9GAMM